VRPDRRVAPHYIAELLGRFEEHRAASVVATVNGHEIRRVVSARFGVLYAVGGSGTAFGTLEEATAFAEKTPT
jgi:hypothetical protein